MCGEVEDTDSDSPNNRICHTCISKRSLSNPVKRKQGQYFLQPGTSKKHKPGASGASGAKGAGGESVTAPPPYSDLSEFFGPLEDVAQSAGNSEAGYYLRKAKMSFLAAQAAKPTRQVDIRAFLLNHKCFSKAQQQ